MTEDDLLLLLKSIQATQPEEIDCEELLARVAEYLEQREAGRKLGPELEQVREHLAVCPPCQEEFDALLRAYGK